MAYELKDTEGAGRGVFSTKNFAAGQEVFRIARPLVICLDDAALEYTCEWCFDGVEEASIGQAGFPDDQPQHSGVDSGGSVSLLRCTGCRTVKYCSKRCQLLAWKHHHKLECKSFASFKPKILPTASRVITQLVLRRQKGLVSEEDWARFIALQHHIRFFKEAPDEKGHAKRLKLGAIGTKQQCGLDESVEEVETWFARVSINHSSSSQWQENLNETLIALQLYINAQTLVNPIFHPLGQCLDPLASSLNHSCMPNAVITFSGPEMALRATGDIAKGEEIFISYIDPTSIAGVRQWELGDRYFFNCECPACVNNLYCDQPDPPTPFRQARNSLDALNSLAALDELGLQLQERARSESLSTEERYLTICQGLALYLQQDKIGHYPPGRQPFSWFRYEGMVELLARSEWLPAMILLLQTYFEADPIHFPYEAHPVRVVHAYTLSKLAHHLSYSDYVGDRITRAATKEFGLDDDWAEMSYALLGEVLQAVAYSHGESSRLARHVRTEGVAAGMASRAREFIERQQLGPDGGIRDRKRWKGARLLADRGWTWFREHLIRYVVLEKLDPGLRILLQTKQESVPVLLEPI